MGSAEGKRSNCAVIGSENHQSIAELHGELAERLHGSANAQRISAISQHHCDSAWNGLKEVDHDFRSLRNPSSVDCQQHRSSEVGCLFRLA
ncbi:MAG: hypothetical protein IPH38_06090 [Candidatus Microthrix sp.]|nr:hypothetical protein [Candidatus Microthrix sp.]MBK7019174.1 hypothetical protein [Candidatus Microthrix sp.]